MVVCTYLVTTPQLSVVGFDNMVGVWPCQSSDCTSFLAADSLVCHQSVGQNGGLRCLVMASVLLSRYQLVSCCLAWYVLWLQISITHNCYIDPHGAAYQLPGNHG